MAFYDSAAALPHWHTPVRTFITFTILWAIWRYLLGYVLAKFLNQHISIGRVSWFSLNDIEWSLVKHTRDSAPARIQSVHVERVGLVIRSGGAKKHDSRLGWWMGVAVSGVRVKVSLLPGREDQKAGVHGPSGEAATPIPASSSMSPSPSNSTTTLQAKPSFGMRIVRAFLATAAVIHDLRRYLRSAILRALPRRYSTYIARFLRRLRHRTITPLLHYLNIVGRRCNFITVFLAIEVADITVLVPQANLEIKMGLFRVGGEIVRGWSSHLGAWFRAEGVAVCALPDNSDTKQQVQKAFELPGPLLVEAKANFDPAIGMAGLYHRNAQYQLEARKSIIDLSLSFPGVPSTTTKEIKGSNTPASLRLRTDVLLLVAQRMKDSLGPENSTDRNLYAKDSNGHIDIHPSDDPGDATAALRRQNPAAMLKSFKMCIPLVRIESRLSSSSEATLDDAATHKKETYVVDARLRTLALEFVIGGTMKRGDKHSEWFGSQARLKASARLGFEKLDIDVSRVRSDRGTQEKATRLLELSPTGVHISSTWLPARLDTVFAYGASDADPSRAERLNNLQLAGDRNASRLVVEGDIGGVSGEAGIELVDDLLRMLPKRKKDWAETSRAPPNLQHQKHEADASLSSPLYIHDPPVLALVLELGQCGFRIHGPKDKSHRTDFGPGEDDAELSPGWQAPSALCLQIPSAAVHITSEYVDVCLKRTDAQRREAKRQYARGKMVIPEVLSASTSSGLQRRASYFSKEHRRSMLDSRENTPLTESEDPFLESQSPSRSPAPASGTPQDRDLDNETFMSPHQETQKTYNAPLSAHRGTEADLRNHPFVYRVNAGATCERVDFFLLSASGQSFNNRTNPTSAGPSRHYASQPQHGSSQAGNEKRQSKSTIQARHNISHVGPLSMNSELELLGGEYHRASSADPDAFTVFLTAGERQGWIRIAVESIGGDISHFDVHHSLNGLITTLAEGKGNRRISRADSQPDQEGTGKSPQHPQLLVQLLPPDIYLLVSLADVDVHLAGPDPLYNPGVCRGMALQASSVTLEYYRQSRQVQALSDPRIRALLGLVSDIRTHSSAEHFSRPDPQQAYCRLQIKDTRLNPVKDAGQESRILKAKTAVDSGGGEVADAQDGTWEYKNRDKLAESDRVDRVSGLASNQRSLFHAFVKDFFWIPDITLRISLWSEGKDNDTGERSMADHLGIVLQAPMLIARVELFQVYCFLMAFSALRAMRPKRKAWTSHNAKIPARLAPVVRFRGDINETHIYLTLPHDVRLFGRIKRFHASSQDRNISARFEHALLAGASIMSPGQWDDILRMRDWQIDLKQEPGNAGYHDYAIYVQGSGARLRVPFKYPFANIIDNTATFVKTVKQLRHQFLKGKYTSAVEIVAEEAKKAPKIQVALKILVLEAEDDPFETKLNLLCRVGKEEQQERLAREQAFADKAASMKRERQRGDQGTEESDDQENQVNKDHKRPQLSVEDAYAVLQSVHSQKWIKRHRNASLTKQRREEAQIRRLYGSISAILNDSSLPIKLVKVYGTAPLLRMVLENPLVQITKPSFADTPDGLANYLADVGKGMPRDTKYSLLVPFHIDWQMSEARVQVRDYPLPLLYIPPVQQAHSNAKSWHLSSDFVIAEEMGETKSIRHVPAEIVPRSVSGRETPYVRSIPRSAMPTKTYALPVINISSTWATRLGWGNSIQPAIQDIMRVLDSLSKAPPDPSDRMGFWDKLRLILHWRIQINFLGDGPLHIILKGSRDPYSLEGIGAGFALCWRNNVRWRIGMLNKDREFLQITSQDFVLGIPNLDDFRDAAATGVIRTQQLDGEGDEQSTAPSGYSEAHQHARNNRNSQEFRKICAKFMGGVKWGSGIQLERTCRDETCDKCSGGLMDRQCRFFEFKPHYLVKTISGSDVPHGPNYDSYAGFRSDFIHFSVSVVANSDASSENSIHLTPNGFTHFWAWWHLFDGTMSLPVRHGRLFPSIQPPSKKFGKHTATIKYRIQLAPVYIAHTYKQDNWQDWREGCTTVLGVKGRIGSFNVDMHQREQEIRTWSEALQTARKRLHKAFHRAEIDCQDTDMRVLAAQFSDPHKADVDIGQDSEDTDLADLLGLYSAPALLDEEMVWLDLDDFRDLNLFLPDENPKLRISPCFRSPRLTYSRYSQAEVFSQAPTGNDQGSETDQVAPSKFGEEPTHYCLLDRAAVPVDVQLEAAEKRLAQLQEELREHGWPSSTSSVSEVEHLKKRSRAAQLGVEHLRAYKARRQQFKAGQEGKDRNAKQTGHSDINQDPEYAAHFNVYDDLDDWINRLIVHNPNFVISQSIRDILMRYYFSSRQSRLSDYAMTSRAIKFIKELAEGLGAGSSRKEKEDTGRQRATQRRGPSASFNRSTSSAAQKPRHSEDLLEKLLNDEGGNWSFQDRTANSDRTAGTDADSQTSGNVFDLDPHSEAASNLPDHWGVRNSFLVSLLKPQIALNSDSHSASTVILTSLSVQLRVFGVVDEAHLDDPINATVMHRSFGSIDSLQAFYPHMQGWRTGKKESMLHRVQDFVPFEVLTGAADDSEDLDRIVPRTSARLRYDKHNRLRLLNDGKKGHFSHGSATSDFRSTVDRLSFECDRFSVSATPKHYAAIYDVVTNLLLHTDPEQKARSQKVESVVLSKDFSDREGIAGNVQSQQEELRNLRAREISFTQRGQSGLSEEEIMSAYATRVETIRKMDVLTLWMGALQTAQDSKANTKSMGMQLDAKASEIVWHMRDAEEKPLVKVGVKGVAFRWLNRSDGNIANCLVIQDLTALNSSPEHNFSEIISKYPTPASASSQVMRSDLFVAVLWSMLAPVGGISVIDRFEVHLHPVRVQLEQKIGKQLQEYLFAQKAREKKEDVNGMHQHAGKSSASLQSDGAYGDSNITNGRRLRPMKSVDSFQSPRRSKDDHSMMSDDSSSYLGPNNMSSRASFRSGISDLRHLRHAPSSDSLSHGLMKADDHLDADEMRERSRVNRTFLHVEFFPTILCLSFKGDKYASLYDLYGLIYKSPTIIHCNRIWSYGELVDTIKRDFKSSIWSQSATLLGQILTTARHKPRNAANAVQQRLLGTTSDKDKSLGKKKKSIMSPFRSRRQSDTATAEEHKTSPLRSVVTPRGGNDAEEASDESDMDEDDSFASNGDDHSFGSPDRAIDYATNSSTGETTNHR